MQLIVFSYPIKDFVNDAQVLSLYRGKAIAVTGAQLINSEFKLSDQDDSLIKKYLKSAAVKILDVVSGYTKGIQDYGTIPFEYDVTYNDIESQIVYRLLFPDNFVTTSVNQIDESIKDAIVNYILYRSAKLKATEFQSFEKDWEESLSQIRSYLQRRNTSTVRNMNLF